MNVVGLVLAAFVDSALAESKEHNAHYFISWDPSPAA